MENYTDASNSGSLSGDELLFILGNYMVADGGFAYNDDYGTISASGSITSKLTNSIVYGGASNKEIANCYIAITGGENNIVYGGSYGSSVSDGVYIHVTNCTNMTLYVGGYNSNTASGQHSTYAVQLVVASGDFSQLNLAGYGCTITGNINASISNATVNSLYTGGGINCSVTGNIKSVIYGSVFDDSIYWTANIFGGGVANTDITITGTITTTLSSGRYQGLIYGGSRAQSGCTVTNSGDITLTVRDITHEDNVTITSGSTAWLVGAGQALDATLNTASVSVTVQWSTLGYIVGGAQAEGTGVATVSEVNITIKSSTITNKIFAAGYASEGGTSIVTGDVNLTIDSSSDVSIQGDIYGGGNNPDGDGIVTIGGDVNITFTGSGDLLSFSSTVNGLGQGNCSVSGTTTVIFDDFTGDFSGSFANFDCIMFSGDTVMSIYDDYEVETIHFDLTDRTEGNAFVTESFLQLGGDEATIALTIGEDSFSFALMDVSEMDLDYVIAKVFDIDGTELGSFDLLDGSLLANNLEISFELYDDMLVAKGTLA